MVTTPLRHGRVLVVEDDREIARLLIGMLSADGHRVATAGSGPEGLAAAVRDPPDLILLDLGLPGLGGLEVCRQLKADPATRLIPVLILTGADPSESRVGAWEAGADEYLTKPVRVGDLLARARSLLRLKAALNERDSAQATLFAFTRAVEAKCPYTLGHTERVTARAVLLAEQAGLSAGQCEVLRRGAMLHDIGKIGIPDAILNKPARLTSEEYVVVKRHPLEGVRIVEPLRSLRDALPFVRWHHERRDGRGYPDGLAGDAIPLAVRVLSVVDVFDALASDRPYRKALEPADCLAVMREDAALGGLDPELVDLFADLADRLEAGALPQESAADAR